MATTLPPQYSNLGFDPDALREKYLHERDRRIRPEGNDQYRRISDEIVLKPESEKPMKIGVHTTRAGASPADDYEIITDAEGNTVGAYGKAITAPGTGVVAVHRMKLFLDEKGKVLKTIRSLPPRRFTRPVAKARYVLEVPVGTIDASGTCVGDELTWQDPPPYSLTVLSRHKEEGRHLHDEPETRK